MVEAVDPMPSDPMPSGRWMASENPVPRHKPPTRASVLRDQSARHAHTYRALGAPGRLLAAGASAAAAARSAQPAAAAAALAVTHRRPNSAVTRAEQARSDKCWLGRRGAAGRGWAGGGGTSPSRRVRRPAEEEVAPTKKKQRRQNARRCGGCRKEEVAPTKKKQRRQNARRCGDRREEDVAPQLGRGKGSQAGADLREGS